MRGYAVPGDTSPELILLLPKEFRLLVARRRGLDALQANFEEIIDCELDRMTSAQLVH
jgi:hypothetical protein